MHFRVKMGVAEALNDVQEHEYGMFGGLYNADFYNN